MSVTEVDCDMGLGVDGGFMVLVTEGMDADPESIDSIPLAISVYHIHTGGEKRRGYV